MPSSSFLPCTKNLSHLSNYRYVAISLDFELFQPGGNELFELYKICHEETVLALASELANSPANIRSIHIDLVVSFPNQNLPVAFLFY